ncbi:hypothetical protein J2T57_001475 [Natronocella acetinitrilica]|uniref:Uncharacterized protein n=1 Tax=Natronocella acetinitrilica TaxID=414046 RepID=A0AAE3KC12_9GAMM|nr:hypothetical protein [Natronocella acetinitrilica]MCP1674373.1 hypothetical protein [Natronocella acetinitrilica]
MTRRTVRIVIEVSAETERTAEALRDEVAGVLGNEFGECLSVCADGSGDFDDERWSLVDASVVA